MKVNGWKMIYQVSGHQKHVKVTIFIADKVHFKSELARSDKCAHYILIKGTILQKDTTIAPNFFSQNFIKTNTIGHKGTGRARYSNRETSICQSLQNIDNSAKKINKKSSELNCTIEEMDLTCLQNILSNSCGIHILPSSL
jgi:hypothetical protein